MKHPTQLASFGLFDAKVPRYTSYPTAPHFGGGVDKSKFIQWVQQIHEDVNISLYLHVPFCRRLCWFCACRTQGTQSHEPVAAYLETLKAELSLLKSVLPKGVKLSRLHWGGGTPTLLSADMIRELAEAIAEVTPMAPGGEFSVEIDPNEIDQARVNALAEAGMNRASIGVQDFDDEIQQTIGRLQTYDQTRDAADMLRTAGITSLNADILFGLPHQTTEKISQSVQKLLSLAPDRVALYGYAHVPWMAKRQQMIPSDALPSPYQRLELYETARALFHWDGYVDVGIDHFAIKGDGLEVAARSGKLKRNFQGYTDDDADTLIGVGASSISRFPQGYAQNAAATSKHTAEIRDKRFSTSRGHVFTNDDLLRSRIIESVMCDFKVDRAAIIEEFDVTPHVLDAMFAKAELEFPGILEVDAKGLRIPVSARPLTRMIAHSFDAYDLSKTGHSTAI